MRRLKKHLGQNLLTDKNIIDKEIALAGDLSDCVVLEIGAGTGLLTKELAKKAKKVIAIEKDPEILEEAEKRATTENVEFILADAMKIEWPGFDRMVANIPYKISSGLTFKLLEQKFQTAVLICQKEFGERLVAKPGKNYSRLSVNAQLRAEIELCGKISRNCFTPKPKVDSVIVRIRPKRAELPGIFDQLTKAMFSHKRKLVKNALVDSAGELGLEKKQAKKMFKDLEKRAIHMSPEEIVELAKEIEIRHQKRSSKDS